MIIAKLVAYLVLMAGLGLAFSITLSVLAANASTTNDGTIFGCWVLLMLFTIAAGILTTLFLKLNKDAE
jgi:hypothetical protein